MHARFKLFYTAVILLLLNNVNSQTINNKIISSGGGLNSNSDNSISINSSLGNPVGTGLISNSNSEFYTGVNVYSHPVIKIKGEQNVQYIYSSQQPEYKDLGAIAYDALDGDITFRIISDSNVSSRKGGVYTVTYNVVNSVALSASQKVRKVVVNMPIIKLNGDALLFHQAGKAYQDKGATAQDLEGVDISDSITVVGEVDASNLGDYVLLFSAKDSLGNEAVDVERVIRVVDYTKPVITLIGERDIKHEAGNTYFDLGANVEDEYDGNIKDLIIVNGKVDINTLGTYVLKFNLEDKSGNVASEIVRKVEVVDTFAPSITLLGDRELYIAKGGEFLEPGYEAFDNFEGDLTELVEVRGFDSLNTSVIGEYFLVYTVSDSSGNSAIIDYRKVIITEERDMTLTITGFNENSITINFQSDKISKYILQVSNDLKNWLEFDAIEGTGNEIQLIQDIDKSKINGEYYRILRVLP